jgi:hypothetical protein
LVFNGHILEANLVEVENGGSYHQWHPQGERQDAGCPGVPESDSLQPVSVTEVVAAAVHAGDSQGLEEEHGRESAQFCGAFQNPELGPQQPLRAAHGLASAGASPRRDVLSVWLSALAHRNCTRACLFKTALESNAANDRDMRPSLQPGLPIQGLGHKECPARLRSVRLQHR